ncbi:MAG: hypothetical protein U0R52_07460 [Solirubrobacterales bacterium]
MCAALVGALGFLVSMRAAGAEAAAPPAPLSAQRSTPPIDSAVGSGAFGRWGVDRFGLPLYRYLIDEESVPWAAQPELGGDTAAQHELGNDRIVAAAFNHGYTQLWSQDRLAQWANRYEPAARHFAGGYGYLNVGGRVLSTLHSDRPAGSPTARRFGVGYYERRMRARGLDVREEVYAPFGNSPLLLHDVSIRNRSTSPRRLSWFEYWDLNPYDQTDHRHRGTRASRWDPARRALIVPQERGDGGDARPLSVFAASLRGPLAGHEASAAAFFGAGDRAAPAEVAADQLSGGAAPAAPGGATAGQGLFAFRAPLRLAPGQRVTLRYAYGMAHPAAIPGLLSRYRGAGDPFGRSERRWRAWLPVAGFGPGRKWVAREFQWDAYLLRATSVYEEACGHHTVTQGGYYQYSGGANLGSRSWLHYLLPLVYAEPRMAREILRFSVTLQSRADGQIPYGDVPFCKPYNELGTSTDLDFWLLLAAAQYGLGSRDLGFFSERLPFTDSPRRESVWRHLKLAFRHQESLRGPHGGYLAGTNGDWSDFSAIFLKMSESMLIADQLAYAYPRLATLAELRGDRDFAARLRRRARQLLGVVRREWTGLGWYSRGYTAAGTQIGYGAIFGEPQPWAILDRAPGPARAARLVSNIRRFLTGVGAPAALHGPAEIGSAQSPAASDPAVTEPPTPFAFDGSSQYVGGSWYDIDGWLTWALAGLQGEVPGAARYAWSEYSRNTLAAHARAFPRHWGGIVSVDDACNAFYASRPERCGVGLYPDYDGQITEQPTWMVMNAVNLAGVTPTARGFRITPHLRRFDLRLWGLGIERAAHRLRGYFRVERPGALSLGVGGVPAGARELTAWADGRRVPHARHDGLVWLRLPARAGRAADWALVWR